MNVAEQQWLRSSPSVRRPVVPHVLRLLVGLSGMVCAVLVPFAPVLANETFVTWPIAGQPPVPTTAIFVPARPAELHATIPASAVRAGQLAPQGATVLSTDVPGRSSRALIVSVHGNDLHVLLGGMEALATTVPPGGCAVRVDSTSDGARVVGCNAEANLRGWQYAPEVRAFTTDLAPQQAAGMHVMARPHVSFENAPTTGKLALVGTQLALMVASLVLLWWDAKPGARADREPRPPARRRRLLVDAGVVLILAYWVIVGPLTDDDGFATVTIRNAMASGDIGNYYRWINASEAPFTLLQHMLEPLVSLSLAPPVLRLPSAAAGIALWVVVSRGVLPVLLPAVCRAAWLRLITASALLAWWLPYDLGVRPESFVALGSTTVLALLLRGSVPKSRGLLPLGLAALVAALTISINPIGILALVPAVLLAPRLARTLAADSRLAVSCRLALLGCVTSTAVVAMFGSQSWSGAVTATQLHEYFGPAKPWYREIARYEYLLGNDEGGNAAKRLPVLLTLALLVPAALLISRGLRVRIPQAHVPPLCAVLAFASLSLAPSKWSHHFGALAGFGAVSVTMAVVLVAVAARDRPRDGAVLTTGLFGGALAVTATAVSFAGKNNWYSYSEYGQPWTEGPVAPWNHPLLWVGAVGVVGLLLPGLLSPSLAPPSLVRRSGRTSVRAATCFAPAAVGVLAPMVSVLVLLGSFTAAPLRIMGGHSVAAQNLHHLTGGSCGIVDKLVAMPDLPGGTLRPMRGDTELGGFAEGTGYQPAPPHEIPGVAGTTLLWGSNLRALGNEANTGALTTLWFSLPPTGRDRDLAVSVAGRTGDGNRVSLEFGHSERDGVRPLGQRVLDDAYKDPDKRPIYPNDRVQVVKPQDVPRWRVLSVPADQIPRGADVVRVHAVDATTDKGGWVAVTQPRLRKVVPLRQFLAAHGPVLLSSDMSWSMPCIRNIPVVRHGLATTPESLILPSDRFAGIGGVPFNEDFGGTFTGLPRLGELTDVSTKLLGPTLLPKEEDWGHLMLLQHTLRFDAYAVHTIPQPKWGW